MNKQFLVFCMFCVLQHCLTMTYSNINSSELLFDATKFISLFKKLCTFNNIPKLLVFANCFLLFQKRSIPNLRSWQKVLSISNYSKTSILLLYVSFEGIEVNSDNFQGKNCLEVSGRKVRLGSANFFVENF